MEHVNLTLRRADWVHSSEEYTVAGITSGASEMLGLPQMYAE